MIFILNQCELHQLDSYTLFTFALVARIVSYCVWPWFWWMCQTVIFTMCISAYFILLLIIYVKDVITCNLMYIISIWSVHCMKEIGTQKTLSANLCLLIEGSDQTSRHSIFFRTFSDVSPPPKFTIYPGFKNATFWKLGALPKWQRLLPFWFLVRFWRSSVLLAINFASETIIVA